MQGPWLGLLLVALLVLLLALVAGNLPLLLGVSR